MVLSSSAEFVRLYDLDGEGHGSRSALQTNVLLGLLGRHVLPDVKILW